MQVFTVFSHEDNELGLTAIANIKWSSLPLRTNEIKRD